MTDPSKPDAPRALSLNRYQTNFQVSVAQRIAALGGAPAFASRRLRWDRAIERFWADVQERRDALWAAAAEGRIDDGGKEVRMSLLDSKGRDPFGERLRKQELFRDRLDVDSEHRKLFDFAWLRYVERLDLTELETLATEYSRWFPIEANLPTDPDTGSFLWMGKPWTAVEAPTTAEILERFPALG